MSLNTYTGGSFDDFLEEENLFAKTSAKALKRVIVWQIQNYLETNQIKKTVLSLSLNV